MRIRPTGARQSFLAGDLPRFTDTSSPLYYTDRVSELECAKKNISGRFFIEPITEAPNNHTAVLMR